MEGIVKKFNDFKSNIKNKISKGVVSEVSLSEEEVRSYLDDRLAHYCDKIVIRKEDGIDIVDVEGDFYFRNDIVEIPFQFGVVSGTFSVDGCIHLVSLKGSPKQVGGNFECSDCFELESLEGCPEIVDGNFWCHIYTINHQIKFTEEEVREVCEVGGDVIYK